MAIALRAAGAVSAAASGNITPALPTGWQNNDFALCIVASLDNVSLSISAGWTLIDVVKTNGTGFQTAIWRRRLQTGDTAPTITHTAGNGISGFIIAWSGVSTVGTGLDVAGAWRANASSSTITADAVILVNPNSMLVMAAGLGTKALLSAWSNSLTEEQDGPNSNSRPEVGAADHSEAGTGSTGSRTCTGGSAAVNNGILVALRQVQTTSTTKTSDGRVKAQASTTKTSDGRVKVTGNSTTKTSDGRVKAQASTTKTSDGRIKAQASTTKASDGRTKAQASTTKTSDGRVKVQTSTTKTSDGRVKSQANTTKTSDGRVKAQASTSLSSNARAKAQATTFLFSDGRVKEGASIDVLSDARVRRQAFTTMTSDAAIAGPSGGGGAVAPAQGGVAAAVLALQQGAVTAREAQKRAKMKREEDEILGTFDLLDE